MHFPPPNVSVSHRPSCAIPVTILTGFLGAGKTTLLNRILNGDHGLKVAVLVNDFGSINIDAELVVGVESDVISLANGCVCCSIRDDLRQAVLDVLDRLEKPEYVVLEASGVADPAAIALTFLDEEIRERIRLDSIICVIDAEQVFKVLEASCPIRLSPSPQATDADGLAFQRRYLNSESRITVAAGGATLSHFRTYQIAYLGSVPEILAGRGTNPCEAWARLTAH